MVSFLTVKKFRRSRMVGEYLITGYNLNAMPLEEGRLVKSAQCQHYLSFPAINHFGLAFDALHCSLSPLIDLYPSVWTVDVGGH